MTKEYQIREDLIRHLREMKYTYRHILLRKWLLKQKMVTVLYHDNHLIYCVEHIGIEPMTS